MLALTIAATVHISVLGAFHPVELELQPVKGIVLIVEEPGRSKVVLDHERTITLKGPARVSGLNGSMVRFRLGVPGGVHREYLGKLEVRRLGYRLLAIVEMDREVAVASIVEAETNGMLPIEARKAQAVVTRSYLIGAHNRHEGFDFCDTDHCQLMKGLPPAGSAATTATAATRGQVLTYRGEVVPALYSANCGGHTKSLAQSSWSGAALPQPGYPYFGVVCPLRGHASGHGVGMCQMGALEIAKHGYSAQIILGHFFPHTKIESLDRITPKASAPPANKLTSAPARRIITASVDTGAHVAR
jgi:hypothetical protein